MIPTDRYYHSGPGNGANSILTKLSVMPFCRGAQCTLIIQQSFSYKAFMQLTASDISFYSP